MADIKLGASALDGFYIGSTAVDKVYVGDVEIFSSAPPFDSGLVLNGVFSDTSNLTLGRIRFKIYFCSMKIVILI